MLSVFGLAAYAAELNGERLPDGLTEMEIVAEYAHETDEPGANEY